MVLAVAWSSVADHVLSHQQSISIVYNLCQFLVVNLIQFKAQIMNP